MRCHALRALTIGLVLALAAAAPAAEPVPLGPCGPIDRPYDSVELTGSQLHRLGNVPIARLGLLAFQSLFARDFQLLLGIFFLSACLVVLVNLVVDLLYTLLDPRIEAG